MCEGRYRRSARGDTADVRGETPQMCEGRHPRQIFLKYSQIVNIIIIFVLTS